MALRIERTQEDRLALLQVLSPDGNAPDDPIDFCVWDKHDWQCDNVQLAARSLWHVLITECCQWETEQGY